MFQICRTDRYDKISTEFRGIFRVFVNFVDLPEFRGSATAQKIRNPVFVFYLGTYCKFIPTKSIFNYFTFIYYYFTLFLFLKHYGC